ncbi:sulfite oxidase heme-binding subunit YedZ [Roseospira visakhapatnamensis]|uniref:Protein-methionine-sulfoxide reductase heme-binding subunit MsrQ n=1 Tax=Roseospira visakhapatnamensis TaxID=390880 RepID=A0A7W6REG1_9PROT|nr:protein-methionine-sulfoxide reductase heme-binding subunit MsrQ [Roseospira visakhapatnamensis]MBB4266428.1 sulfoxide reductase heme-binding subunit YedZ [Roseospira visakhapatnamensis]
MTVAPSASTRPRVRSPSGGRRRDRVWRVGVFLACALPLLTLAAWTVTGDLGVNPIETIVRHLGDWALRLLVLTLALTPLRHLTGSTRWVRHRRMVGLWAFAYAVLHVSAYAVLDVGLHGPTLIDDLTKRPYIMVGMGALLTLIPLAVTSTQGMVRRLGGRAWRRLHRLVYLAGILAATHYLMMVKADITDPMVYIFLLVVLLGARVTRWLTGRPV